MYDSVNDTDMSLRTIPVPKQWYITTMTFIATLSYRDLRVTPRVIEDLGARRDTYFTTIGPCAFSPSSVEFHSSAMPSVRTKLFNKGSLQITGCKSHVQAMHNIVEVCRVVSSYVGMSVEAVSMSHALINVNITFHDGINLTRFARAARTLRIVAEQPERPPSCILKIPCDEKMCTVLVYKPGKCTICAPHPIDISRVYSIVMRILDDVPDILEQRTTDAIRRGRGQFTWMQLVNRGMPGVLHHHVPTTRARIDGCVYCTAHGNCFNERHQTGNYGT
jgi:TATA-box binding protein (TBP) (component of TFIID and TFIIIB)